MLNGRRFDYYHRGLHEAWREVAAHRDSYPLLMVEPHLALAYAQPVYFTFNRADAQLKRRFEEGLAQIRSDGSYHQLFLRHFGELVRQSRLSERRLIRLQSEAPAGLPEADSSFWLQPSVDEERRPGRHFCLLREACYSTSNSPAAPMPPPTHMVTTTYFTPRRLPSSRAWPTMRAPLMP